jgi:hypothetical protein
MAADLAKNGRPLDVLRTDESGEVDLEQIEYNLSLTPAQRLQQLQDCVEFAISVRRAGEDVYGPIPSTAPDARRR